MPSILLVDDERVALEVLKRALAEGESNTVLTANSYESGLELGRANPDLDVVVVDKNLDGGQSGLDLIRALRDSGIDAQFVMITGFASVESAREAVQLNLYDYIPKPFQDVFRVAHQIEKAAEMARGHRRQRFLTEQIESMALTDRLTGLASRALCLDRAANSLRRAKETGQQVGLAIVDLDAFRKVNLSLGQSAGNELLTSVADRLRALVGPGDTLARIGGDEFVALIEGAKAQQNVNDFVAAVSQDFERPFNIAGQEVYLTVSFGVTVGNADSNDPEVLLREAGLAKNRAKARGGATATVFEPSMDGGKEALELEVELRRAIEQGELVNHYQPLIQLESGRIVGFEALVRWQHPDRGLLYPDAFLPLAEDTGLIVPLGEWCLGEAARTITHWNESFADGEPRYMSVNISTKQLVRPDFIDRVRAILPTTGVEPSLLTFELTESLFIEHSDHITATLDHLKSIGVRLAMDDFGTGYSSLSYLFRFPFDILKIDQVFIRTMEPGDRHEQLVQAIIAMAHGLDLSVTAEGIEEAHHFETLKRFGCKYGQGWHFSKAIPQLEAEKMLSQPPKW